nr:uncharacterized protein LOC113708271 [Coffea arabica]
MDFFPFYRSQQRPKPSVGNFRIPVRPQEEEAKSATRSQKVVQIPVQFVGSESGPDCSKSASKIQKVFRGFLVRKSMRKIMAIKKEVDEIEARVWRSEEVELLEKDGKERLKVNEMLMALLFRLDSVRGVDSGVRDCRKSVIRKAIALQERVDAIAAAAAAASTSADVNLVEPESETLAEKDQQPEYQVLEIKDEAPPAAAARNSVEKFDGSEDQIPQNYGNVLDFGNNGSGQGTEERNNGGADEEPLCEGKISDGLINDEESGAPKRDREDDVGADLEMIAEEGNRVEDVEKVDAGIDSKMKVDVEARLNKLMPLENIKNQNCCEVQVVDSPMEDNGEDTCERTPALSECVEESLETRQMEDVIRAKQGNEGRKYGGGDDKRNRELLEMMMEKNEKMMKLMTQLNERNEVQMRMLNTLTQRVEKLEKAFVCDMIKRKKKRA